MEQRPHRHAADDDEGQPGSIPVSGPFDALHPPEGAPAIELEPGWAATRALIQVGSDELLAVMLRPSFRPVKDLDLVPVFPCSHCRDGGLRTAGSVRTRKGREPVRACDTCGALEIGGSVATPHAPEA
jgi:hypothetical protein